MTAVSPNRPMFDPKALLNPRAAPKRKADGPRGRSASPKGRDAVDDGHKVRGPDRMGSMIERIHNVGAREYAPHKRRKADEKQAADAEPAKKYTTFDGGSGSGSVLSDYVKKKQTEDDTVGAQASRIVDLTVDEDEEEGENEEEEVVLVRDNGDEEVCIGKVDSAYILAYQLPSPQYNGFQGTSTHWPGMRITFRRRPGINNSMLITAIDPSGKDFGRLDPKIASALASLLDASDSTKLRVIPRLEPRKRKSWQRPGEDISESLALNVTIYCRRRMAPNIGRFLSQRQVALHPPAFVEKGIPIFNPHVPTLSSAALPSSRAAMSNGSSSSYITRTVEEVRNDVMGMFDSLTKTEDLPFKEQDPQIVTPLLPHQKQALYFLSRKEKATEISEDDSNPHSLWRVRSTVSGKKTYYNIITGTETKITPPPVLGGILADMMGLGKTLSILALVVDTLDEAAGWHQGTIGSKSGAQSKQIKSKATLLVCPLSTISNWEEQIQTHVTQGSLRYYIYHGSSRTQDVAELARFDLVITTYSIVASEFDKPTKHPLQQIDWFRIVLDEAHMIRAQSTKQSQAICTLSAQRRWAVTGTPVQNRLDDLGALVKFLRIKPFDERNGFTQFIIAPFKTADPEILPKLRLLVDSVTLRRLKDRIDLPARRDQIVRLEFSENERTLYELFAKDSAHRVKIVTSQKQSGLGGKAYVHILRVILRLRLICAHGQELLSDEDLKLTEGMTYSSAIDLGEEEEDDEPILADQQAFDMFHLLKQNDMDRCSKCNRKIAGREPDEALDGLEGGDGGSKAENVVGHMTPCYHVFCPLCIDDFKGRVRDLMTSDKRVNCPECQQYIRVSYYELRQDKIDEDEQVRLMLRQNPKLAKQIGKYTGPHTKTRALLDSLHEYRQQSAREADEPPIKSVVFSGWTAHLDLIQLALEENSIHFTRLDGSMSRSQRTAALNSFRDDSSINVILVSIAAGGLGLNLTAASRAFVMEPQFNPAAEAQAVDRVHRLGQRREVCITRFIMQNSFEEKMLELQQKKRDLADLSMNRNVKLDKAEAAKRRLEELRSLFK